MKQIGKNIIIKRYATTERINATSCLANRRLFEKKKKKTKSSRRSNSVE